MQPPFATPSRTWLEAIRADLAVLGDTPTLAAIEALSARLAARALQIDAPRAAAP